MKVSKAKGKGQEAKSSSHQEKFDYYMNWLDREMERVRLQGEEKKRKYALYGVYLAIIFGLTFISMVWYLKALSSYLP